MSLVEIIRTLGKNVGELSFAPPVTHVYNPLRYAWPAHRQYLERWGKGPANRTVLVGMNPGPWGMAQTGVPFGEVNLVRNWLGITEGVRTPEKQHTRRPIEGFACRRSEVSGARLWGWAKGRFGTPSAFFERFFVYNYCPLSFLEESGRNRTPDKLKADERQVLFALCDQALVDVMDVLRPGLVLGVGVFAENRTREALADGTRIGRILHPSPANPLANRGWAEIVEKQLAEVGVRLP